jgi:mannosyltransferase OCH1-like enzyme
MTPLKNIEDFLIQFKKGKKDKEYREWPKIIHQIWFDFSLDGSGNDMGKHNRGLRERLKEKNKKWKHWLWAEKSVDFLIRKYYSKYWLFYNFLDPVIRKVDYARFFILHFYGGIYLDMDYYCIKGFDDYFSDYPQDLNNDIILNKSCYGDWITNSIMMSREKNPFWLSCIEKAYTGELIPWWGNLQTHLETSCFAGPYFMTESYREWVSQEFEKKGSRKNKIKIISEPLFLAQNFEDCKYFFHEGHTSWISKEHFLTPEFLLFLMIVILVMYKNWG